VDSSSHPMDRSSARIVASLERKRLGNAEQCKLAVEERGTRPAMSTSGNSKT
jgi:hypothetical protein